MDDEFEKVETDLGKAEELTLDDLIRTTITQMFKNDNNVATLEVTLGDVSASLPPTVELQLRLLSINGKAVPNNMEGEKDE